MGWYWYRKSLDRCEELLGSSWRLVQLVFLIGSLLPLSVAAWKSHRAPRAEPGLQPREIMLPAPYANPPVHLSDAVMGRRLFPYSVIPGGAVDAKELKAALLNDPIVAEHYKGFDLAKAHVIRLDQDRAVYVSYRLGGHIYWTTRRLTLLKGEMLLTDGEHEVRTRCGNRISQTPKAPVSLKEPEQATLENPPPPLPNDIGDLPFPLADLLPVSSMGAPPSGGIFIPPFIPILGGSGTAPGTTAPGTPTAPIAPPVATPEPATLVLLSAGFFGLWVRRKSKSS
jgi:PEP-CTERM motif